MVETTDTNSGAHGGAEPTRKYHPDDVVFTTILRKDRDWLKDPLRLGKNRADKLHKIIELYKSQHPE